MTSNPQSVPIPLENRSNPINTPVSNSQSLAQLPPTVTVNPQPLVTPPPAPTELIVSFDAAFFKKLKDALEKGNANYPRFTGGTWQAL